MRAKDLAHATVSSVMVEGANILNVVTCDCITLRLASKHDDEAASLRSWCSARILRICGSRGIAWISGWRRTRSAN